MSGDQEDVPESAGLLQGEVALGDPLGEVRQDVLTGVVGLGLEMLVLMPAIPNVSEGLGWSGTHNALVTSRSAP
ncbi:hypothetical protein [Streptomyces sp. NBC_00582]|uniref:hypothetical protein n=1 Tax=Streptomyces sp. NBC_00582 TaxID=2975783 RepID=UPI002E803EAD|nr:hypothetical protein [Streptomyces sp. NBC_00582]WUB66335.1 hypothetical protein OG852_40915 [Streptomyces sp. NBC_00582]